jgi:FMN phosphatase YigB (HAD superfamily)
MPSITHIFFDLHGTLIHSQQMHQQQCQHKSEILAARYGKTPADWHTAMQQLAAEWDSYHIDLNFSGDDGMSDFYEALFRTTRALFKLVQLPEPPQAELTTLARELPAEASCTIDAFYPDAKPVLNHLHEAGYQLGIAAHSLQAQAQALLEGGGVVQLFAAPIIGADTVHQFDKDVGYYRKVARIARTPPEQCLVVDDDPQALHGAQTAQMSTVLLARPDSRYAVANRADGITTLAALPDKLAAF